MVPFKQYILEYAKFGDNLTKLKSGTNGKNYDNAFNRKHVNTVKKEYKHKHPLIDSVVKGISNNIPLKGQPLAALLNTYQTDFVPGVKTLGNSGVEVEMYEDEEGTPCGILRNKNK